MSEHPVTDVTTNDPVPADEQDEVIEGTVRDTVDEGPGQ